MAAEEKEKDNDTLRRANRQIERMESIIDDLLMSLNIQEMTAKERIDSAAKLIGQEARMLMIRQTVEAGMPQNTTNIFLAGLMRQMRGEVGAISLIENIEKQDET